MQYKNVVLCEKEALQIEDQCIQNILLKISSKTFLDIF